MSARTQPHPVLALLALLAFGPGSIPSCKPGAQPPPPPTHQVLRIAVGGEPSSLDPGLGQWPSEAAIGRQVSEALMRPQLDLKEVEPLAAESMKVSEDGLTYTFHLRPGLRYGDGQPVRAADFVYAWSRIIDPRLAAPSSDFLTRAVEGGEEVAALDARKDSAKIDEGLKKLGLKAPDEGTFVVTLARPQSSFKWLAAMWTGAPVRRDAVDGQPPGQWGRPTPSGVRSLVTNGPFQVSEIVPQDHITLVRNPRYSGIARPTLERIVAYTAKDAKDTWARYQRRDLDMVAVPFSQTEQVVRSKELHSVPQLVVYWVDFNTQKPPFDSLQVRQAFTWSIDRAAYLREVLHGRGLVAAGLIPQGMTGYRGPLGRAQDFNPDAARAALQSSGVSRDAFTNVHLLVGAGSSQGRSAGQFLRDQWRKTLGLQVAIEEAPSDKVAARLRRGDYQLEALDGWQADYPDQQDWLDIFRTTDGSNHAKHRSRAYDELVRRADQEPDQGKRDNLYALAQQTLVDDLPVAFIYQPVQWWLIRSHLSGYQLTPMDDSGFPGSLCVACIRIG